MVRTFPPIVVFITEEISKVQGYGNVNLGDMAETLIEYGIKWFFWEKDFRIGRLRNKTFSLIKHNKADKITGTGGVDFYLKFRIHWRTYRIFIEVKNWDDWLSYPKPHVSNERYNEQILSRYTDYDKLNLYRRILVIPKGYRSNLKTRCDRDRITIIPLQIIILPVIANESFINYNLMPFLRDFSAYITELIPDGIIAQSTKSGQKTKTDEIWDDIKKGMPPGLVALVYSTTVSYVYRVKSERRKSIIKYVYRY